MVSLVIASLTTVPRGDGSRRRRGLKSTARVLILVTQSTGLPNARGQRPEGEQREPPGPLERAG